jgi:hypothetical protein
VRRDLDAFLARTQADELMIVSTMFDHAARLRSYEILAGIRDAMESRRRRDEGTRGPRESR